MRDMVHGRWSMVFGRFKLLSTISHRLSTLSHRLRQVAGMPDYAAYLRHLAERHPGQEPMTEAAFFTDYLERRYANGPNRCC